jgi:hypothetical protein
LAKQGMIIGAHTIIFSKDAEADRSFLRDIFGLDNIDAGDGWLIFSLPDTEIAVHPASENNVHETYFLVEDIHQFVTAMVRNGVPCSPIQTQSWGLLVRVTLPGGGDLGVYQPLHKRPGK